MNLQPPTHLGFRYFLFASAIAMNMAGADNHGDYQNGNGTINKFRHLLVIIPIDL